MSHRRQVLARGLRFPEGPLFDADGGLWCSEIEGGGLARLGTGTRRIATGGRPNGLALAADGCIWFCDGAAGELRMLDPVSGSLTTRLSGLAGPNDLAFDRTGNLLFSCCAPDSRTVSSGTIECLFVDGRHAVVARGLFFPNGLAFADEGETLIVAETYGGRIWSGDWQPEQARWHEQRVLGTTTASKNGPDGLAVDDRGLIFVAVYGSGGIDVFAGDGTRIDRIETGGRNPTSCAFDPTGALGLVVTEAEHGMALSFPGMGPGLRLFRGPAACASASC